MTSFLLLVLFLNCIIYTIGQGNECQYSGINLQVLQSSISWMSADDSYKYELNLCVPFTNTNCPAGTRVCRTSNSSSVAMSSEVTQISTESELWLQFKVGPCAANNSIQYLAVVYLRCGKTLGSPNVLLSDECAVYFDWPTTALCKEQKEDLNQVPCYVYDSEQHKYDLSELSKEEYIIHINSTQQVQFAVCRSLANLEGAGAFYEMLGGGPSSAQPAGKPATPLKLDGDRLVLEYRSENEQPGCTNLPRTTLTFVCPENGGSTPPQLLQHNECQLDILWETEHACAQSSLVSTSCQLKKETHGIDLDLSSLARDGGFHVANDKYNYTLSVCGNPVNCGENVSSAACQILGDGSRKIMGKPGTRQLKYVDGEITLSFQKGDVCRSTNFQRETVIQFLPASPGDKAEILEFESEDSCSYYFRFYTSLVPNDIPLPENECAILDANQNLKYDLSLLERPGEDWNVVVEGQLPNGDSIILNMCTNVKNTKCGATQACLLRGNESYALGSLSDSPHSLHLEYGNGAECNANSRFSLSVTLICAPGLLDSPPMLMQRSADGCKFKLEWHTAAACVQTTIIGEKCRVDSHELGLSFDLSPLHQNADHWEVIDGAHSYSVAVCNALSEPCGQGSDAGVCQTETGGQHRQFSTGAANSLLKYENGMLSLRYDDGDLYGSGIPRTTSIMFICDRTTNASLRFTTESDSTYSFDFFTRYACPASASVECVAQKDGDVYDLSSLSSASSSWLVTSTVTNPQVYLALCGPLMNDEATNDCPVSAAVCAVPTGGASPTSLGQSLSPPTVVDKNHLQLTYTQGDQCHDGIYTTTVLDLWCQPAEMSSNPQLSTISSDSCAYHITWNTSAACTLTEGSSKVTENQCSVTDPNSGHVFNLMPLRRQGGYTVENYTVNVCGLVPCAGQKGDTSAAVCSGGNTVIGSFDQSSTLLEYLPESFLRLSYTGPNNTHSVIRFVCDHNVAKGEPHFVELDGNKYVFEMATGLACKPEPVDCRVSDEQGREYDLSGLARPDNDWKVVDDDSANEYYINMCSPLVAHGHCSDEGLGGCQLTSRGNYSMGYVQSRPQVTADGLIVVRYIGGDICHKGTATESFRSTLITLECSKLEHGPEFMGESDLCEYSFLWRTPSACSVTEPATGSDCSVNDTASGVTFDFRSLRGKAWVERAEGHWYSLAVCDDLTGSGCHTGVAVCQADYNNSSYVSAGKSEGHTISYEGGDIKITYTGGLGSCHGQNTRHSVITFRCDYSVNGTDGPRFVEEDEECTYFFEWWTSLACPRSTAKPPECQAYSEDGSFYDLSDLTLSNGNQQVMSLGTRYVLNVCGPVVPGGGVMCPVTSAFCYKNSTETDWHSIGDLSTQTIEVSHAYIKLEYSFNNRQCRTELLLSCGAVESSPSLLIGTAGGCSYTFQWTTPSACARTENPPSSTDCTITDPSGAVISLSSLARPSGYTMDDGQGRDFTINVCKPLNASRCQGNQVAACQAGRSDDSVFTAGLVSSQLKPAGSCVQLLYDYGAPCHGGTFNRSTVVNVCCGEDSGPMYVDEDAECTYYVMWNTPLACTSQVSCTVVTDTTEFDLSPLSVGTPRMALTEGGIVYMRLCGRGLGLVPGTVCPPGADACLAPSDKPAKSLGYIVGGPRYDADDKKVYVELDNGDVCPGDPQRRLSATVRFVCRPGLDLGDPVFVGMSTDGCHYQFEWSTNVVCQDKPDTSPQPCSFHDDSRDYTFDFSSLTKEQPYEVQYPRQPGKSYLVSPCSNLNCGGPVCEAGGKAMASLQGVSFVSELKDIKLVYGPSDTCQAGSQTVILFRCNETSHSNTSPTLFVGGADCGAVFEWTTALACLPQVTSGCRASDGDHLYDLRLFSRQRGFWSAVKDGYIYYFNLCQSVHGVPHCPRSAAVYRSHGLDSANGQVLGRLDTQSIRYTDGHILVEYGMGDAVCGAEKPQARLQLHLRCAHTTQNPSLDKVDESSCLFSFEWKTRLACEEQRENLKLGGEQLREPTSGATIDLRTLTGGTQHTSADNEGYVVSLLQPVQGCEKAAVCLNSQSVGDLTTARYFFEGDVLEAEFNTSRQCESDPGSYVSSLIFFRCPGEHELDGEVTFEYTTPNCVHVLSWNTYEVCLNISIEGPSANGGGKAGGGGGGGSASVAGAVVGVLLVATIIVLVAFTLSNRTRREAFTGRLRSLFRRRDSVSYSYSQLSGDEDRAGLLGGGNQRYGADLPTFGGNDDDDDLIL